MPIERVMALDIPDIKLIRYRVFDDIRGFFAELYKRNEYLSNDIPYNFVQVNLSFSRKFVVRGLHYQLKPHEQGKLIYVVKGRIYDVAVDIRRGSPWYGKYVGEYLSTGTALWIPPGFAHGFQALEDTYLIYLVTKEYAPSYERCIKWNDSYVGVRWPYPDKAITSEKDSRCPEFSRADTNFVYGDICSSTSKIDPAQHGRSG